jgi:hypothetical protein
MFVPLEDAIQRATSEVLVRHPLLMKATKNRNGADPFVIATARVKGLTVVTEEKGGTTTKPKIPSVCQPSACRVSTCSASSETRAGASCRRQT